MLPPVDLHVLAINPKFDTLYRDLCTTKLNEDATTQLDVKVNKEHDALQEELRRTYLEEAKRHTIRTILQDLAYRDEALPDDLLELVALMAAMLCGEIAEEDKDLVSAELERFKEHAPHIAAAISKRLREDSNVLERLLANGESIPQANIPANVQQLKNNAAMNRNQLAQSRLELVSDIQQLHNLYRQAMEASIRILEQTIHGSVARGTKAKADYLATVAEGMSKKLSVQHGQLLQQVYSSETQEVLKARASAMQDESVALRRKIRDAEEKLDQYRSAKGMQSMATEYAEIVKESEKVKDDISRLEKR
ncbi:hypothetical protein LTR56_006045 [Elasticomyces elasticus]|nr:hypothetical protein LTR56_006045 [Elasticomyces elasticus]KAK3668993.1 hypothetical protein LTR22_000072 [Elasticomyces elasticus]KAK4922707.1 hypothetical protein LTR49_010063 [Elasticomyces elasticus]KAK5760962.1 hypothetical protein LTS12_008966 [Elasticomyces elasticus]